MEKPFANLLNFSPSPFLLRIFNGKILTQILKQVKYFHNAAKLQPNPPYQWEKRKVLKNLQKNFVMVIPQRVFAVRLFFLPAFFANEWYKSTLQNIPVFYSLFPFYHLA